MRKTAAESAAERAGVELRAASAAAPGLVQAEVVGDRDRSIDRLRADDNVVHHVYRDRQASESEYLITETFFDSAGFSLWFGHGKVNAFRAVDAARQGVQAGQTVDREKVANLNIPDVGTPVLSPIAIDRNGTITDLRIQVNISHTYIGDLRVDLIAPDGTAVVLHNNTGGSAHDLNRTYSVQETPALRPLLGRPVRGTWQLRVVDTFRLDVGRLNRWRIVARTAAAPTPLAPRADGTRERAGKQAAGKRTSRYAMQ